MNVMNQLVTSTQSCQLLASRAWQNLNGVFAVYKPSGLAPKYVKHIIQTALIEDLNKLKQRPQKSLVKIVQDEALIKTNPSALTAVRVPDWVDHPLVRGPLYSNIKLAVVSGGLDIGVSGVMVLAVKHGTRRIEVYQAARMPKTYTVKGRFGIATDTHDAQGKIWQKSTFHHVTREKFDRVISNLQRSHQKVMFSNSGVDVTSQEAYELAARGMLRPFGQDVPTLLLNIKCTQFESPDFELEIECIRETAQYLRKTVHDLAQDMKTCAVATQVRRVQDGPFTVEHALLRKQWRLPNITEALRDAGPLMRDNIYKERREINQILAKTRTGEHSYKEYN